MTWWAWALASTIFWGMYYLSVSRMTNTISPIGIYWLPVIPITIALPIYYKVIIDDFNALMAANVEIKIVAAASALLSVAASLMFYKSLSLHPNATHVTLIQITYPVFVAIFALMLFGENQFSWSVVIGGLLILTGAGLIIYYN